MKKIFVLILSFSLTTPSWAAMKFDGTNDYITHGDVSDFDFGTGNFTISAWIYPESISAIGAIVEKRETTGTTGYIFDLRTTGKLNLFVADGTNTVSVTGNAVLSLNTWYHVVAVVNRGGNGQIYVNGVLDASSSVATVTGSISNNGQFVIGRGNINLTISGVLIFNGSIDDVRIYNRALSTSEIESLALSRSRLHITDGLVGYWRLDDGTDGATASGTGTALDISGKGYHGTPTNGPIWRASNWVNIP